MAGLVSQLTAKGFPRHTAKRAVLATRGRGFQEALRWTMEHSMDDGDNRIYVDIYMDVFIFPYIYV